MDVEIGVVLAVTVQLALILPLGDGPETAAVATLTSILKELGEDRS